MSGDGGCSKEMFRSVNKRRKSELLIETNNRTQTFTVCRLGGRWLSKGAEQCALGEGLLLSGPYLYVPASRIVCRV